MYLIIPLLVIVASNSIYNICSKSISTEVNAFASLTVTYLVASITAFVIFLITGDQKNIVTEISKANVATLILGLAIVGLETGFIYAYRAGWKISNLQLTATAIVSVILLIVGVFIFKEKINAKQIAGMAVCGVGLFLLS